MRSGSTKFQLLSTTVVPMTRDVVKKFKAVPASPTERPRKDKRVAHLRKRVDDGDTLPFIWVTAQMKEGNKVKKYRMNGQHSLDMLSSFPADEFPENLTAVMVDFSVESKDGLAWLFRQFDDKQSTRDSLDISHAYQGLHDDLNDVPMIDAKLAIEGYAWWGRTIEGIPVGVGDDIYASFGNLSTHEFIKWVPTVLNMKTPELRQKAVVAAMYATYQVKPHEADAFWKEVAATSVNDAPTTAAQLLDQWLVAAVQQKDPRRKMKPGQLYQGCVYAWRASTGSSGPIKDIRFDTKKGYLDVEDEVEVEQAAE